MGTPGEARHKAGNGSLGAARRARNDEFYTQMPDIERELGHYDGSFEGKVVYCNCDDPLRSNFFRYFVREFDRLGLRRLTATCMGRRGGKACRAVVSRVPDAARADVSLRGLLRIDGNELAPLEGDGDFRSDECLALLDEADVVVTNPPFSLLREYVPTLASHGKEFLVVANMNAVKYRELFPLVMRGKMWLGHTLGDMTFSVPDDSEPRETRYWQDGDGRKWRSMGNACWLTNLDAARRYEEIALASRYSAERYPRYDDFDAIEVSRVADIPYNYEGVMGVPITFLARHSPDQFELVGELNHGCDSEFDLGRPILGGRERYARILIRNRHPGVR